MSGCIEAMEDENESSVVHPDGRDIYKFGPSSRLHREGLKLGEAEKDVVQTQSWGKLCACPEQKIRGPNRRKSKFDSM